MRTLVLMLVFLSWTAAEDAAPPAPLSAEETARMLAEIQAAKKPKPDGGTQATVSEDKETLRSRFNQMNARLGEFSKQRELLAKQATDFENEFITNLVDTYDFTDIENPDLPADPTVSQITMHDKIERLNGMMRGIRNVRIGNVNRKYHANGLTFADYFSLGVPNEFIDLYDEIKLKAKKSNGP